LRASTQIDVAPTSRLRHEPRTAFGRPCRRANSHGRALRIPRACWASGFVLRCTRFDTTSNEAIKLSPKMSRASDSVLRESIRAASSPLWHCPQPRGPLSGGRRPATVGGARAWVPCRLPFSGGGGEGPTPRRARRVETRERSRCWRIETARVVGRPPSTVRFVTTGGSTEKDWYHAFTRVECYE
jgi:hypothetical protein